MRNLNPLSCFVISFFIVNTIFSANLFNEPQTEEGLANYVNLLEFSGADINDYFQEGTTPLIAAVKLAGNSHEFPLVMRIVEELGADTMKKTALRRSRRSEQPLHLMRRYAVIELAQCQGVPLPGEIVPLPNRGALALHFAAAYNNTALIKYLLIHGPAEQAHARDDSGHRPIDIARLKRNTEAAALLEAQ